MSRRSSRSSSTSQPKSQRQILEEAGGDPINHSDTKIYCVQYGDKPTRTSRQYSQFFFCSACDLAEEYYVEHGGKWPPNWKKSKFKCTANHTNPDHPTQLKSSFSRLHRPVSFKRKDTPSNSTSPPKRSQSTHDQINQSPTQSTSLSSHLGNVTNLQLQVNHQATIINTLTTDKSNLLVENNRQRIEILELEQQLQVIKDQLTECKKEKKEEKRLSSLA